MAVSEEIAVIPNTLQRVFTIFRTYPAIIIPFFLLALSNLILLAVLFLASQTPISFAMNPVIQKLWGDEFLHYPVNFLLLPKLLDHAMNFAGFFIGVALTGIAISMITQAYYNCRPVLNEGMRKVGKYYFRLAEIWGTLLFFAFLCTRIFKFIIPYFNSLRTFVFAEFLLNVFIQLAFIYAIPSVMVENKKVFASYIRSFRLVKEHTIGTVAIIVIPSLLLIPLGYVQMKMPEIMERMFPETMLYWLSVKIVIIAVVDLIVTACATVVLLNHRDSENAAA